MTEPTYEQQLDAVQADLRILLNVLGLGDHARPYSPHSTFMECVREVERIKADRDALIDATTKAAESLRGLDITPDGLARMLSAAERMKARLARYERALESIALVKVDEAECVRIARAALEDT